MHHVANTKSGNHAKQGKGRAQPCPVSTQAIFDVIHRTTDIMSKCVYFSIFHCQNGLSIFCRHTKQGNHPHPENGTRSAKINSRSYPCDVARADGGGQGRHQGLKWGYITFIRRFRCAVLPEQGEGSGNMSPGHGFETNC